MFQFSRIQKYYILHYKSWNLILAKTRYKNFIENYVHTCRAIKLSAKNGRNLNLKDSKWLFKIRTNKEKNILDIVRNRRRTIDRNNKWIPACVFSPNPEINLELIPRSRATTERTWWWRRGNQRKKRNGGISTFHSINRGIRGGGGFTSVPHAAIAIRAMRSVFHETSFLARRAIGPKNPTNCGVP